MFLANALSRVLLAVVLAWMPEERAPGEAHQPKAGYRDVFADRALRTVLIATLVLAFTGYAAVDSGLPAYGTVVAHVSVHIIALSITVNTAVIVAAQLVVLRWVRLLRRSRALALVGLIWAVSWAVFWLASVPASLALRIACVFGFAALFAPGETVMAPTVSPLVNSLAGDQVRRRANALSSALLGRVRSVPRYLHRADRGWLVRIVAGAAVRRVPRHRLARARPSRSICRRSRPT